MTARLAVAGVALLVAGPASIARAQSYTPFTAVASVCPSCTTGPAYDTIVLNDGTTIRARVVAENDRFVVLERFAELRAVGRDQLKSVEKNPAVERPASYPDQILVTGGIVLAGTLKSADGVDPMVITVPGANADHVVTRSAAAAVYRGGVLVTGAR